MGALVVGLALAPAPRAQVSLAMPAEAMALEALGVRAGTQQRLQLPDVVTQAIVVPVVIDGQAVTLHLLPGSVRAPGFQLLVAGADGVPQPVPALPSAVVRGTVEQWPGSVVSGSMRNGRLRALVLPGDPALAGGDFAIDPLDADGEHLVYRVEDAEFDADFCGVGDEEGSWASGATIIGGSLGLIPLMTCDVAADSDVEFFQDLGSSVDAVVDHIEATLAGCTAIYEQQLGIELALVALVVRTEEPDPFFTYEGGTTLDELGEHWSVFQSQYDPDLVQLFTGKHYPGIVGLGSVGSVCHETNNVSLTESLYYSAFAKQVRVSNHEFGHNFGAGHCSTQPDCGIMCPAQCGPISTFGQQTVQTILMTKLTVACLELAEELALPEIFSTAPDSFPSGALGGFFVVNGVGLTTVIAVDVGTTQVSGSQVMVLNDETIMVAAPLPTALGPVRVVVHTAAGSSNPGQLVYGPTSPPLLQAPFAVSAGNPVKWMYGGDLGHTAVLLVSASGATMSAGSHDVLAETVVVHIGPLNAAALGRYTLPGAPASLAGLQLFSQVVMFTREGLDAASFVRTTNVLP
ncbi:MAG: hypothetical protein DRQ55_13715 [Planctomycetota bacterium]|nr:MAG: hypothetical protein DRQ55_13715 [Planctomycetota bacterium]